mmetsp:Transcript_57561/g.182291  ORF Transcript_57561/g.182291 Transcript_57561/m.182291 type:complete len:164 (+) Transcript_57561:183-674(+)
MGWQIFLSFREADVGISAGTGEATKLKDALVGLGFTVFLSEDSIPPGSDWHKEIGDAITGCEAVVAFCTKTYGESKGVSKEMKLADLKEKPMLPVLHSGDWPPKNCELMLADTNYTPWEGAVDTANKLLETLKPMGITPSKPPGTGRSQDLGAAAPTVSTGHS